MANLTEGIHAAEFLVSEAPGHRSREEITVLSGQDLVAGQVLGKVTLGTGAFAAFGTNVGACTCGAITVGLGAKPGVYKIVMLATSATGAFVVEDPDGQIVGHGNVGSAFSAGGLGFTISNGGTNTVGDSYKITVAAGSGKFVKIDPEGTDGRNAACGILFDAVDASDSDLPGVAFVRDCEVNRDLLNFDDADAGEIATAIAELAALGIIVREGI